jgi:site-specific recombinase XerD
LEYFEIEKGRSIKTVENYDRYLSRLFRVFQITSPAKITEQSVREFRIHLNRQPGYLGHDEAQDAKLLHDRLRAFLKFLRKRDIESLNPERIELGQGGARDLDLIPHDELEPIMNGPKGDSLSRLRDKAILELFFSTGLRVSELCSINRDLDLSRDEFSIRGKGEKVRVVFLSPAAKALSKNI